MAPYLNIAANFMAGIPMIIGIEAVEGIEERISERSVERF